MHNADGKMRIHPVAIRAAAAATLLVPLGYAVHVALRPRAERFARLAEYHRNAFEHSLDEYAPIFAAVDEDTRNAWAELSDDEFAAELGRRGGPGARKAARRSRYHLKRAVRYQSAARWPLLRLGLQADDPPPN